MITDRAAGQKEISEIRGFRALAFRSQVCGAFITRYNGPNDLAGGINKRECALGERRGRTHDALCRNFPL